MSDFAFSYRKRNKDHHEKEKLYLNPVYEEAEKHNVSIDINHPHMSDSKNKREYHISWIESRKNKGDGEKVIKKLHEIADKRKMGVTVVPLEGHPKLISYYKKLGYEDTGEDSSNGPVLRRQPK